jgi:hypothetical protein
LIVNQNDKGKYSYILRVKMETFLNTVTDNGTFNLSYGTAPTSRTSAIGTMEKR